MLATTACGISGGIAGCLSDESPDDPPEYPMGKVSFKFHTESDWEKTYVGSIRQNGEQRFHKRFTPDTIAQLFEYSGYKIFEIDAEWLSEPALYEVTLRPEESEGLTVTTEDVIKDYGDRIDECIVLFLFAREGFFSWTAFLPEDCEPYFTNKSGRVVESTRI